MLFMLCIYFQILLRGGHPAQHTCLHAVPAGRGDQERGTDELLEESGQFTRVDIVMKIVSSSRFPAEILASEDPVRAG